MLAMFVRNTVEMWVRFGGGYVINYCVMLLT